MHRDHEDEHPYGGRGFRAYGPPPPSFGQGSGNPDHFSEMEARRQEGFRGYGASSEQWHGGHFNGPPYPQEQHGYGQSQYPYSEIENRGPHYGKGPKGYKRSDDRIREEVCELMSRQGYIDASDVEVTVEGGIVRLVGFVATRQDKRGLEQIADRVHGVEEVRNELRLRRDNASAKTTGAAMPTAPASTRAPLSQNGRAHS